MTSKLDCTITYEEAHNELRLTIPSTTGQGNHTPTFPITERGMFALARVLKLRNVPTCRTIGTDASPTNRMVEDWMKVNKVTTPSELANAKKMEALKEMFSEEELAVLFAESKL